MAIRQQRIIPLRSNLSAGISGAALSPTTAKIVIPAQEMTTIRMVLKMKTIPPSQALNTPDGRTGKLAPMNRQWMETWRMTITCPSPKTR